VLFVCVHNAGRSQMAAGLLAHLAGDRIEVRSAGTEPADQINPAAAAAMDMDSWERLAADARLQGSCFGRAKRFGFDLACGISVVVVFYFIFFYFLVCVCGVFDFVVWWQMR
jgi:hypothetical protein